MALDGILCAMVVERSYEPVSIQGDRVRVRLTTREGSSLISDSVLHVHEAGLWYTVSDKASHQHSGLSEQGKES